MDIASQFRKIGLLLKNSFVHKKTLIPWTIVFVLVMIQVLLPFDWILDRELLSKKETLQHEVLALESILDESKPSQEIAQYQFETISKSTLDSLNKKTFGIQKYHKNDGEIFFWSRNSPKLTLDQLNETRGQLVLMSIESSHFLVKSIYVGDEIYAIVFNLDEYLSTHWNRALKFLKKDTDLLKKEFEVLAFFDSKSAFNFHRQSGSFLFSIKNLVVNSDLKIIIYIVLYFFEVILFLWGLNNFGRRICKIYPVGGVILIVGLVIYLRKLFLFFKFPFFLYSLKLFNPSLYSSTVTPSLGDLLIFIFLMQYLIIFANRNLKIDISILSKYKLGFLIHTAVLIFFLGEAFSIRKIFEGMVLDSSIWFNFNYFPRITLYSLLGLTVMLMSLSNYYILMRLAIKNIVQIDLSIRKRIVSFCIVLLLLIFNVFMGKLKPEVNIISFFLFTFMGIVYWRTYFLHRHRYFSVFLFLLFASLVTTFLLTLNNTKKENLVLSSIASNMSFGKDTIIRSSIIDYVNNATNFQKIHDTIFNQKILVRNTDIIQFDKVLSNLNSKKNLDSNLIYTNTNGSKLLFDNSIDSKSYLAEISKNGKTEYFEFLPNNYINQKNQNSKTQLNNIIIGESNINYALYSKDSLIEYSGNYPYKNSFNYTIKKKRIVENSENSYYTNLIFDFPNQIKVLVTTYLVRPVSTLTLFSYIFCFDLILYFLYQMVSLLSNLFEFKSMKISNIYSFSLSEKIMLLIFLLIVSIFTSISILSYQNLEAKSEEYNKDYLTYKLNSIQFSLQSFFQSSSTISPNDIQNHLNKLSKYNSISLMLYDTKGKLMGYTNEDNPYKVDNPTNIDPLSFWSLEHENTKITKSHISTKKEKYMVAYSKVYPTNTANNYIFAIPFSQSNKMKSDISNFTVALINLYIFLFFISLIIAFWMANTITKPLKLLTEKMTKIKFSSQNEHLEYKYQDEIGELVKKYNTMVDEIEYSAKQMAFNEREEAWREMAQQIAHEIKNPLTPMKLKIQYLQKKINDNADDIEELTLKVSDTLIEQINNLDMIATSFSNFARINEPKLEKVDLLLLTKNVSSVFDNNQNELVEFKSDLEHAFVLCDHTQIVSCLNNLIKNAFQAQSNTEDKKVYVHLYQEDNTYKLEVKDLGIGMSDEIKEKIFTPKFTTKSFGTGLGLSITKKFLDSIGASIELETKQHQYTIFTITIKIYNDSRYVF